MNRRGFSLIELICCVAVAAFVLFMAAKSIMQMKTTASLYSSHESADFQIMQAVDFITRVGRVAQSCVNAGTSLAPQLRCTIDFNHPPTGVYSYVQFTLVGTVLQYQLDTSGAGTYIPANMQVKLSYSNVGSFTVCGGKIGGVDDADFKGTPPPCAIGPSVSTDNINTVHAKFIPDPSAVTKLDRFFRFKITESLVSGTSTFIPSFQSAFYIRNAAEQWTNPATGTANSAVFSW